MSSMQSLLRDTYFPYGSQYYRAPSPKREEWDRDLGNMAELGFTMVKYWVQWRWNHPAPDRFDFGDIDELMDLSRKHGLKVMLNTIVDVAPAWIYRTWPDASLRTLDGRRIGPQTQPHRQIGGLGLCLNHPRAVEPMFDFLAATIRRYKDHPALEIWNIGSEPELTQSMSEMRRWADDASRMGDMMCHCSHCEAAFKVWLEHKYGDIRRLNTAWNRNYDSFEDAELPRTRNTFNDVVDWRMFFVHTLGENVRRRFEVARRIDAGHHPLMCHHVFIQGFPVTSTANDPWNVAQYGDLHGFTQMDDAMMHDILRSCARGKPVMSAEMLMLMGYTLNLPRAITVDDIKRHIFTGIAANLKGFLFWQYRPETLGREAPTWGLSHLDGSSTPWLEGFADIGQRLQKHTEFLFNAKPQPAPVAMLYSPENQIFAWASTGSEKTATDSLLGVHRALYDANITVDFLHPKEFVDRTLLRTYRAIVLPFPYWITREVAEALTEWVREGGTLISEAYLAAWDVTEGRHATTIPGYGLHTLFGVRQQNAVPASDHLYLSVSGVVRHGQEPGVRPGVQEAAAGTGFLSVRTVDASDGIGQVEILLKEDLPGLEKGTKVYGALVKETLADEGAEVLAEYADGTPAITRHRVGKGQAILVGSYLGLSFHRLHHPSNGRLLAALVRQADLPDAPSVQDGLKVRVDTLSSEDGRAMVILQNGESRNVETTVHLPDLAADELEEIFSGERLRCARGEQGSLLRVDLGPKEVKVFLG